MGAPSDAGAGSSRERIYAAVRRIPRGRVATYGQIARLAGLPGLARQVGYALAALPAGRDVPWHRVINAHGRISSRADPLFEDLQRDLLEQEGIVFGADGRISLARYRWESEQTGTVDPVCPDPERASGSEPAELGRYKGNQPGRIR